MNLNKGIEGLRKIKTVSGVEDSQAVQKNINPKEGILSKEHPGVPSEVFQLGSRGISFSTVSALSDSRTGKGFIKDHNQVKRGIFNVSGVGKNYFLNGTVTEGGKATVRTCKGNAGI